MGRLIDRTHRELTDDDIRKIADTYHTWRGDLANPHLASGHPLPAGEGQYRGGFDFSGLVERARELSKKQTPAESIMWEVLRDRGFMNLKFRRQHQFGDYLLDFYCDEHKLAVELDGPGHAEAKQKQHDQKRDRYLQSRGVTVLRFRNDELLADPQQVFQRIVDAIGLASPSGRGARGEGVAVYRDIPGFSKAAPLDEIRKHGHVLTPGRYVGAEAQEDDGEPFEGKMQRLTAQLREQMAEGHKLDTAIEANMKELGYGG